MILLDYLDGRFQSLIRRELNLSEDAVFFSCGIFEGTAIASHCIGIVQERGITTILIRGSYELSGDAIILYLNYPGAPDLRVALQEIDKAGFVREMTRFVGVCVRLLGEGNEAADESEIQIVLIPYLFPK
jgi:hypothetical protein